MSNNKNFYCKLRKNMATLFGVASVLSGSSTFAMGNNLPKNKFGTSSKEQLAAPKSKGGFLNLVKENPISFSLAGAATAVGAAVIYNRYQNNKNAKQKPQQLEAPAPVPAPVVNTITQNQSQQPESNPVLKPTQIQQPQFQQQQTNDPVINPTQIHSDDNAVDEEQNTSEEQDELFDKMSIDIYDTLSGKTVKLSSRQTNVQEITGGNLYQRDVNVNSELSKILDGNIKVKDSKAYDLMNGNATLYCFLINSESQNELSNLERNLNNVQEEGPGKYFGCLKGSKNNNRIVYCVGRPKKMFKILKKGTELMNRKEFGLNSNIEFASYKLNIKI